MSNIVMHVFPNDTPMRDISVQAAVAAHDTPSIVVTVAARDMSLKI